MLSFDALDDAGGGAGENSRRSTVCSACNLEPCALSGHCMTIMTREMPRDQRHGTRMLELDALTKAAEIILAKRDGRGGVVIAHGFGEIGLRMGADPRDEQQAPE